MSPGRWLRLVASICLSASFVCAQEPPSTRCVTAELFIQQNCNFSQKATADLQRRFGMQLRLSDVRKDDDALRRLYALAEKHGVAAGLPMLHACNRIVVGYDSPETTGRQYDELLTVEIFARDGCSRCSAGKAFIDKIKPDYPGLTFVVYEVTKDLNARARWEELCRQHGVRAPGVPTFHLCGELVVGYTGDEATGQTLRNLLNGATVVCPLKQTDKNQPPPPIGETRAHRDSERRQSMAFAFERRLWAAEAPLAGNETRPAQVPNVALPAKATPNYVNEKAVSLPPPLEKSVEVGANVVPSGKSEDAAEVMIPLLGPISVRRLGMPVFTILIGLVDGFNPCAMWVLLFLLSILVTLHDRRKILIVAGTFVLVSGVVYFTFMAAWLNAFRLIGLRRWAEVALGMIGVSIGIINIKDFVAFKRGLTLSIPEAARPGIYSRVRRIATAENLVGATVGAGVLAILVNVIELLCTAGLPALYAKVLTMQKYPPSVEYAFLALYNLAYIFDDGLMVTIAVCTLGRHKLQENEGRWLKLVSGCAVLTLGLILLLVPDWLS